MIQRNKIIIAAVTVASLGIGIVGIGTSLAASNEQGSLGVSSLVNAIANTFHLDPAAVQAVFDQQRQQQQAQRQAAMQTREQTMLAQAVTSGKLTQAQADAITSKQAEIASFMAGLKGKAPADIKTAMKTEMDAIQTWAKDNNIPLQYLHAGGMFGRPPLEKAFRSFGGGHGMNGHRAQK